MKIEAVKDTIKVYAPATGELLMEMKETPPSAAKGLMETGKAASLDWAKLSVKERIKFIKNVRLTIIERLDELATLIANDVGKVKTDAIVADIMPALDAIVHIEKHAEKELSSHKVKTPFLLFGTKSRVEYMPRGVILIISPWNYPFLLSMVPMLSALAAGNAVILKPSEVTPAVGKMIEDIFMDAGFPSGVIQVAHGGKELGSALTLQKPDYIFFTGSVKTGKIIQEIAARDLIPTTLELGGKDPMIILKDANLKRAAQAAAWGAFTNSGQVCMSVERVIIDQQVVESFLEELVPLVQKLSQGISIDDDIGSMAYRDQIEIVKRHINDALDKGATLLAGSPPSEWKKDSMFIKPMILLDVTQDMLVMLEETFGPVLPILTVHSEEEALRVANGTEYGLNASIWTENKEKARRMATKLESGAVLINDVLISVANHNLPFGGVKHSGIGRYHGENGIRMFCHEKAVMESRGITKTEIQWYPYKEKYPHFRNLLTAYFGDSKSWNTIAKEYIKLLKLSKRS